MDSVDIWETEWDKAGAALDDGIALFFDALVNIDDLLYFILLSL